LLSLSEIPNLLSDLVAHVGLEILLTAQRLSQISGCSVDAPSAPSEAEKVRLCWTEATEMN
jgi:hypothetical protein